MACRTSSAVEYLLSEKRTDPCATGSGTPIANRIGEGSSDPLEQAAPAEAQSRYSTVRYPADRKHYGY